MQNVRDVLFEEFVFGVDLGLNFIAKSELDELVDFLVVQLQVLCEFL